MTRRIRLLSFCVAMAALPSAAFAQASIAGVVRDTSGGVLPGVTVEASSPALIEKVRSAVTDSTGQYRIEALRPGAYTVTFSLTGFNTIKREGIELSGSFSATVNADMRVGTVEETILVTGEAPVVDVSSTAQQRVLDKEVIDAIPSGRLQNSLAVLVPGVTTNRQDVGGTDIGFISPSLAIHGGRSSDTRFTVGGLSPASGEGGGQFTAYQPNMSSAQELTIDTSGSSAEASTGGVRINLVPREGGNTFSGTFFVWGANSAMQGSNDSAELRARGLTTPDRLVSSYDINPGFGGPIKRDRLWFFSAFRANRVTTNPGGAIPRNLNAGKRDQWLYVPDPNSPPQEASAYFRSVNTRLTLQATARDKFSVFYDDQTKCNCPFQGTGSVNSREANAPDYGFPMNRFVTVNWTSPRTNRLLLEAGIANHGESWHSAYTHDFDLELIGVTEQSNGMQYRMHTFQPNFSEYFQNLNNLQASASYITGRHAVKVGVTDGWSSNDRYLQHNNHGLTYRFLNGVPNQLTMHATPYHTLSNIKADLGIYAQDKLTISRLTLNLGVRFDYFNLYFPEQRLGPGVLVPTRDFTFPKTDGITWKDLTPRLGVAYDVFGTGKTAVKVTLNKYIQGVSHQSGNPINPVSRLANQTTRAWTDANGNFRPDCDLLNPATQDLRGAGGDLCGAMVNANFGRVTPTTTIDPETLNGWGKRQYNWEFSAGVQQELMPRVSLDVGYFTRWFGNFTVTDNRATTAADYNAFSITAPTDSRLPDGGGYTIPGLFDLNPTRVGQVDNYNTFASNFGDQTERWTGVDASLNLRPRPGMLLQGGMSSGRTVIDSCEVRAALPETAPTNPYCHTNTGFVTQFKFLGTYTIPRVDVQVSGTFQGLPGPTIAANFTATNAIIQPSLGRVLSANAPNATINLVSPGTMYGERLNQLDLRFGKIMRFGRTRTALALDLFNALNANPVLNENANYAVWRTPIAILQPRYARISAQFDF